MFKTNQAVGGRGGGRVVLEGVFWRWMVRNVYLYVQDEPGCWGKGRGEGSIGRSLLEVDGKKRLPLCSRRTRLLGEGGGVALEGVFWRWMVRNVYLYVQNEPGCWGKGRGVVALEGVFWRWMVRNVYLYVQNEPGCWGKGRGGGVALEGVIWRWMVRNVYLYVQDEPGCWGKGRGGGGSIGRSLLEVDGKKRLPLCSRRTRLLGEGEGGGGGSIGRSLLEVDGKKRLPLCSKRTRLLGEGEGGGSIGRSLLEVDGKKRLHCVQDEPGCWGKGRGGVALEGVFWRWMVRNVYLYVQDEPGCWGKGRGEGSIGRSLLEVDGKKRLPLCSRRTRLLGEGEGGG